MPPIEATVAIVARDEERLIGGAVRSALAQRAGVEVLVIDDHSTDRTAMIAAQAGARVLTNSGSGLVDARNTAIAAAAADIIMWLDADDRLEPSALAVVLRRFADPSVALVAGGATFVDERGRQLARQSVPPDTVRCRIVALAFNPFNHSAVAIRRGPILELGGYERGIETEAAEDYDLWARLLAEDRVIIGLSTSVVTMEVRKNSESVRSSEAQARRARAIREDLWANCRIELPSWAETRRLGRELPFDWHGTTALDTYALGLIRLGLRFSIAGEFRRAMHFTTACVCIGPIRSLWSAGRAAWGVHRIRRARGWTL